MRILIVEDDGELADILQRALIEKGDVVEVAYEGVTGEHLASTEAFDLIVLDLLLPERDGIEVCRNLRLAGKTTPVIMLTARDKTDDRILGLNSGADDYVVKPFSMGELLARIRAVVRRAEGRATDTLQAGSLSLNPSSTFVTYNDQEIALTAKEFALLRFFMANAEKVLTRTEILENVWDSNYDGLGKVVDVYVNYLRNKLGAAGRSRVIDTVRGRGYILREPSDVA